MVRIKNGGPPDHLYQQFFLIVDVSEIIKFRERKAWEDESFLTDLYVKKGWSLRRISKELVCSKGLVRKKLIEAEIKIIDVHKGEDLELKRKIKSLRKRGMSYQKIAELLNLWKIGTASKKGKWYAKTVRKVCIE